MDLCYGSVSDAVFAVDADCRIFWMNAVARLLFGYDLEDICGFRAEDLQVDNGQEGMPCAVRLDPARFTTRNPEKVRFRTKDGRVFPASISGGAMRDTAGELQGYVCVIRDRSREVEIEEVTRDLYSIASDHEMSSEDKVRRILDIGSTYFDLPVGIVSMIERRNYTVLYTNSASVSLGVGFDLGTTYCVHTLNANGPCAYNEAGQSEISGHPCYQNFGVEAYIGVPLIVDGERFGTLNFSSMTAREPFTQSEKDMICLFAAWIAQELSIRSERRRLEEAMEKDPMTGLLNRASWDKVVGQTFHHLRGLGRNAALLFIDIDHFKKINDAHGHLAGDDVILELSRILKNHIREGDHVGRYGGEEFAMLVEGMCPSLARTFAENLRQKVRKTTLMTEGIALKITISIGVATLSPDLEDATDWVRRADKALYGAKTDGRDTTFSWEEMATA